MGFDSESLELEPSLEDLLTCWGHEVSTKNLDLFFPKNLSLQGPSDEVFAGSTQHGRRDKNILSPWQGFRREGALPVESQEQLRAVEDRAEFLKLFSRISSSNKEQGNISRPKLSGGLEDIVGTFGFQGASSSQSIGKEALVGEFLQGQAHP